MTPSEASELLTRLLQRFSWHLAPWGLELYRDTLEAYPYRCGRMAVGTLEAREVRFPEIETLTEALEAELVHWAATDDPADDQEPTERGRAHIADARRALGQS